MNQIDSEQTDAELSAYEAIQYIQENEWEYDYTDAIMNGEIFE